MSKVMEMYVPKNELLLFFLNFFKNKIFLYVANGPVQFVVCTRCSYYILCNKNNIKYLQFYQKLGILMWYFYLKIEISNIYVWKMFYSSFRKLLSFTKKWDMWTPLFEHPFVLLEISLATNLKSTSSQRFIWISIIKCDVYLYNIIISRQFLCKWWIGLCAVQQKSVGSIQPVPKCAMPMT